jgi:hypothetical protein
MATYDSWRDPTLINTMGHGAGTLLFCVIIILLIRDWRSHGPAPWLAESVSRSNISTAAVPVSLGVPGLPGAISSTRRRATRHRLEQKPPRQPQSETRARAKPRIRPPGVAHIECPLSLVEAPHGR